MDLQAGSLAAYGALPVPKLTPDLLALVHTGHIYSLSVIMTPGMMRPAALTPLTLAPGLRHGDSPGMKPASAAAETIISTIHIGTHIDALCHIGEFQDEGGNVDSNGQVKLYGGVDAAHNVGMDGQQTMSIAEMPPIFTRGVLLDVARSKGVEVLPDHYSITPDDIQATLSEQGTEIRPGTAVLIRTGFYQHLRDGNMAYANSIAGLGLDAAQFLLEKGMMLAGADNMTVEAFPPDDHAVHRLLLVHHGVTHLENLFLEDLSINNVYEFLLIVTPLRLKGATGSWVHPIAIG